MVFNSCHFVLFILILRGQIVVKLDEIGLVLIVLRAVVGKVAFLFIVKADIAISRGLGNVGPLSLASESVLSLSLSIPSSSPVFSEYSGSSYVH